MKKISIIVRTRNEERWISHCLDAVFAQKAGDFEVILVDNESSDKTVEKARQYGLAKIITCRDYLPGKALNMGIRESAGEYIVCLSGHCIPTDDRWLYNLLAGFDHHSVAGVYGRQEAMEFTSDADKRDLSLVFGLDRKVQEKDSFFHNANSMIRKDVWDKCPFDETVTNIEDRVWAKKVLEKGYKIIYEPNASVYHHHGIHQNGDRRRCSNVVRIMETLHDDYEYKSIDIEKMNIVAIVPVRGQAGDLGGKSLLAYTIDRAKESRYIKKVVVSTDDAQTAAMANAIGAETPFLRDRSLSQPKIDLATVFQYSLKKIEELGVFPDLVVCMEVTFPFRPRGFLDDMIAQLAQNGFDSVVAAHVENKAIWQEKTGDIVQMVEGMAPRQMKEPTFIELKGLGCVTHPEFLRSGSLLGTKIGMYEVNNPYSHIEVRSDEDLKMASLLVKEWFR